MKTVDISQYLKEQLILLDVDALDKNIAIAKIVENMAKHNVLTDPSAFLKEVLKRESLGSTAIGKGVALPHARTQNVDEIVISVTRLANSVVFSSQDDENVDVIVLIGTPVKAIGEYLKVLAQLSKLLRNDNVLHAIKSAKKPADITNLFKSA